MSSIFINKQHWDCFSTEEMDDYVERVFNHYRLHGFPYFSIDLTYRINEYQKLKRYGIRNTIDYKQKTINQTMHGLGLAWSYFHHSWDVVCNNQRTPMEVFNDDELFKKVIRKRIELGNHISDNTIRKTLKIIGAQSVSNFRPTAASAIYYLMSNKEKIVTWDMSSGFGGRLLGASLSDIHYIGTDPSSEIMKGLEEMNKDFKFAAELYKIGSECYLPEKNSLDLCFTSPPYFNKEVYSNEDTQSCNKFPEKNDWLEGFLYQTFQNCYHGLKQNKYMVINIANINGFKTLESDTIKIAEDVGFKLIDTWKLALSQMPKAGINAVFKYEPIFIFKKTESKKQIIEPINLSYKPATLF